jgi:hypothetical protein
MFLSVFERERERERKREKREEERKREIKSGRRLDSSNINDAIYLLVNFNFILNFTTRKYFNKDALRNYIELYKFKKTNTIRNTRK